jgi:hypothetical protein
MPNLWKAWAHSSSLLSKAGSLFLPNSQQTPPQAYYSSPILPAEDTWYPDTGANHHITNELQHLNLSHEDYTCQDQIHVGDGTGLPISHIGYASLTLSHRRFILNQLLRVPLPLICKNLLSVRQFAHCLF